MATLTPTLTLTSSDTSSDTLSLSVTDSLTVGAPAVGPSKVAVAASSGSETTFIASGADNQYTFIKHTGYQADGSTATTHQLAVGLGGNADLIRLKAGEFAWFPSKSSGTVTAKSASTHQILVEYAYWTAA